MTTTTTGFELSRNHRPPGDRTPSDRTPSDRTPSDRTVTDGTVTDGTVTDGPVTDELAGRWAPIAAVEPDRLTALHRRLVADAERDGILDVAYTVIDSPVGRLLLAATAAGLVRVAYDVQGHEVVLADLARRISPRVLRAPARLDDAARELDEYFEGRRRGFDVPLDLRLSTGFRRQVVTHLPSIGYGRTESYAQVAAAAGNPRAVRAVGSACATNPLPVVVPCHRVVRSDGSSGGYVGGPTAKHALLTLESTS